MGWARRAMFAGLHVAVAMGGIACQPSPGEPCDDGWCPPGMRCRAVATGGLIPQLMCVTPGACGNGIVEGIEDCDGPFAGLQPCSPSCHQERCGNDIKDDDDVTGVHEVCDDGNTIDGDGCSSDCMSVERCGNNMTDPGEECDGADVGGLHCSRLCRLERCGNGILDPGEQCDNGTVNGVNLNQDSAVCTLTCQIATCGDSKVLLGIEQCDSGGIDTASCDDDCTNPVCGDGHVNTVKGEACDDGALNDTPDSPSHCNQFCQFNFCGNSNVEPGEQCDDGTDSTTGQNNNHEGARCNKECQLNVCGDGDVLSGVEQCDPGIGPSTSSSLDPPSRLIRADSSTCDIDCTFPICGDGHLNILAGEACDDGNQLACGTCPSVTDTDCRGATPVTPTQATSTITTTNGDKIGDGDTLELDDGFGKTITLEFDVGGLSNGNNVPISFAREPATDAATIASRMVEAINTKAPPGFLITASVSMETPTTVTVTNTRRSVLGNTSITISGLREFKFFPDTHRMAGGAAGDCLAGIGCKSGDDCKSGVCSSGTCQCTADNECPAPATCDVSTGTCH